LVDAATLSLVATFVQTAVITLTLIVFIFQFRSQERAIREASYQNLLGRYNDFIMSSDEADDRLFSRLISQGETNPDPKEVSLARRLIISYGIIEEAYELYSKGWIDKESWEQWNAWLKSISRNPHFATIHKASTGMFNREFQEHVTRILESGSGGA
jgi:hypothetical protein